MLVHYTRRKTALISSSSSTGLHGFSGLCEFCLVSVVLVFRNNL